MTSTVRSRLGKGLLQTLREPDHNTAHNRYIALATKTMLFCRFLLLIKPYIEIIGNLQIKLVFVVEGRPETPSLYRDSPYKDP